MSDTAQIKIVCLARWLYRQDQEPTGKRQSAIDKQWKDASSWVRDRWLRLARKLLSDPPEVLRESLAKEKV